MNQFTPARIIEAIGKGKIDPKKDLTPHYRRLIVEHIMSETNWSRAQISVFLKVDRATITRDVQHIEKVNSIIVTPQPGDTMKWAGKTCFKAELLYGKALAKDNLELAWKIHKEQTELLGRMGVITFNNEPINVSFHTHTKLHKGDVIKDGGKKTVAIFTGGTELNDSERTTISRILAQAKSRANNGEPAPLGAGAPDDPGEEV